MKTIFNQSAFLLSLLLGAAGGLSGCGKDAGGDSHTKELLKATVDEKEALLTPLAGRYVGVLKSRATNEEQTINLVLIPTIMIVQNPGRNDVSEMPTLGGNLNILPNPQDPTDVIPVAQFTSAMFDPASGHLRLNGSINTGTSMGNVLNTLEAQINGDVITGSLFNSSRGELGIIEVRKLGAQ